MTIDVSRLGIVVESNGINEARKGLDGGNGKGGLVGAADKAEKAIAKLTETVDKLLQRNLGGFSAAWTSSVSSLVAALTQLDSRVKSVLPGLQSMVPAMQATTVATNQAAIAAERHASSSGVVTNTLKAMLTAATAYSAVNFGVSIVKQADAWQMMEARLQNATGSLHNARVAQNQMFDISQRLRVPLEDTIKLYTRLAPSVQRMGKDSAYAASMVEGISTALQLSGANGAETSSVITQLSQSFSSGVLNGAEFNAVAENGSVLMRALEKYTGKSTAELKKMGSQGKLTMETVGKAIEANLPEWREKFDRLPVTFEGAIQRLKNAWTKGVGEMGQDSNFNKELSKSLRVIEDMIPAVAQGLGKAFIGVMGWVSENKELLGQIWDQVTGLASDVWGVASGLFKWVGNIVGAGDQVSILALNIFAARLAIAGFQDGLTLIKGTVAGIGALLYKAIFDPLVQIVTQPLKFLIEGFSKVSEVQATFAEAVGREDLAKRYRDSAETANSWAKSLGDVSKASTEIGVSLTNVAQDFFAEIAEGRGEVQKLMNMEAAQKQASKNSPGEMDPSAWNASKNPKKPLDANAIKAATAEAEKFDKAYSGIVAKFQEQLTLQERMTTMGLGYEKLGPEQKKVIELQEELNRLIDKGASESLIVNQMTLLAAQRKVANLELVNQRIKEGLQLQQAIMDKERTNATNLEAEAEKLQAQVDTYGMAKGAVEALALAEAKRRREEVIMTSTGSPDTEGILAQLDRQIAARERIAALSEELGQKESGKEFDKLFDARKAEKFGDVLAEGFGKAAKAAGVLMNALDKYESRMAKVAAGQKIRDKETNPKEKARLTQQLIEEETRARLASYADMAGAAKGFFEEGTRGYKAMEYAEKTFRLFQMAMNLQAFLQQVGLIEATTTAAVVGDQTRAASATAAAGVSVAASMASGTAAAATGVAKQADGDPYTAWARMAAMAAVMAGLGFAVGGIGGKGQDTAKVRQASQGTGTVFGDASAKSASIANSLELLSKNSDIALRYSSAMLQSLQSIESSLTGATSGVIRSGSVTGRGFQNSTSGMNIGEATVLFGTAGPIAKLMDNALGGVVSKVLGIGKSTSLKDSGLVGSSQSVQDILATGFKVQGYQDIQTKKKAFGITYSDKTSTTTTGVDPALSTEFGNIVSGMVDTLVSAGKVLGFSQEEVTRKLEAAQIDIGKISLKGLSGEEIQKQLEAVFSAIGDNLTTLALPSVLKFQKAGEGLLETAVRVASGVESASYELEKLGLTAIGLEDLTTTTGDVASEIVRQTILVKEAGTGIGEIISTLSGEAGDIADTYKSLLGVKSALVGLGVAKDVTVEIIRAAGGLDSLRDALEAYQSNFFSEAEQNSMKVSDLQKEFAKLGLTMPSTRSQFRAMVESLSAADVGGQETATKLLLLANSFAEVTEAYDTAVADARTTLTDAYDRESQALTDVKTKFEDFAKTIGEFKDNLLTGDLSTLSVADKYEVAKSKFQSVLAKASAGDENAIASFTDVSEAFLQASRGMFASGDSYTSDFLKVVEAATSLETTTSAKASVAQQQLDALNKQVEGLMTVDASVKTVAEAIAELNLLLTNSGSGKATVMPVVDGSHANGLSSVPYDGYIAELHKGEAVLTATENKAYQMDYSQYGSGASMPLVQEIKALRQELQNLREGQREQTGQLIAANYDAQERNAQAIVEGQKDAASVSKYSERVKVTLV